MHKTANVLNKLPNSQIWIAETTKNALVAFDAFVDTQAVKYDKAVEC